MHPANQSQFQQIDNNCFAHFDKLAIERDQSRIFAILPKRAPLHHRKSSLPCLPLQTFYDATGANN
jgi:hypothetical protein